jgi:hypothetical protein
VSSPPGSPHSTSYVLAVSGTLEESSRAPAVGSAEVASNDASEAEVSRRRVVIIVSAAALISFVALTAFLYVVSSHAYLPDSDGATVILEGNSIVHGNVALAGWSLSYDSFWLLDALYYAVAIGIVGIHGYLLHLVPAVIATLVVITGALIARDEERRLIGFVGSLLVVAVLAFPTHLFAYIFLRGPLHIDTVLCALIAFVALGNHRFGWRWAVAVIFLAAGALGDLQVIAFGTLPLFLAGLIASARARRASVALPATTASAVSVVVALVGREIAKSAGTFHLIKPDPRAPYSTMFGSNLKLSGHYFADLVGVGRTAFGNGGVPSAFTYAHAIVLVVLLASVVFALVGLFKGAIVGENRGGSSIRRSTLDDMLVLAAIGGLVVFLTLTTEPIFAYSRYLVPSVIFATVLAGRFGTRLARSFVRSREVIPRSIPIACAAVALAVVAALASATGFELAQTKPFDPYAKIASFLERHHLHDGLGDYWTSSIVTVESNDAVVVRAVTATPQGKLVRYDRESDASWYSGHRFFFVVLNPTLNFGNVNVLTATATFGRPIHDWIAYGLQILVWRHPISVTSHGIT